MTEWMQLTFESLTVIWPKHDVLPHDLERSADCACKPDVTVTEDPTHFTVTHHLMQHEDPA